jgi:hypothetical protein
MERDDSAACVHATSKPVQRLRQADAAAGRSHGRGEEIYLRIITLEFGAVGLRAHADMAVQNLVQI